MKSKIGILGSGIVAQVLADGFLKYGYEVKMGTRHAEKLSNWAGKDHHNASIGTFREAAGFGEIIVLAVSGKGAHEVLNLAGADQLSGKTIIDVTNPIEPAPPENGVLKFFTKMNESLMERLQKAFPEARFVKSFSCVGNAFMVNPQFTDGKPTMFICGNDDSSKSDVHYILGQFGWDVADMGKAEAARAIEPLCMLWCIPGLTENSWSHAFKLLRK